MAAKPASTPRGARPAVTLAKVVTYVPTGDLDAVRDAMFEAGLETSETTTSAASFGGTGSFRAQGRRSARGEVGRRHLEAETRLEVVAAVERGARPRRHGSRPPL